VREALERDPVAVAFDQDGLVTLSSGPVLGHWRRSI
jgi:hypothetical protein